MHAKTGKIVGITIAVLIVAAIAGWWVFVGSTNKEYYTQIDNEKTEELESKGGVIDPTGGMSLLYTLPCYDAQGNERSISFGTERQLKEDAYLELTVEPIRGVIGWKEVHFDELPSEVQNRVGE